MKLGTGFSDIQTYEGGFKIGYLTRLGLLLPEALGRSRDASPLECGTSFLSRMAVERDQEELYAGKARFATTHDGRFIHRKELGVV
jgi:hypothetical protein